MNHLKNTYKALFFVVFSFLALFSGVYLTTKIVKYFSNANGVTSNIIVDMGTDYGTATDPWSNLAQGGESRDRMLLPVTNLVGSLKPKYIRIDHVFDFYTESELDRVIGDITATGAKPFISLSYIPPELTTSGNVTDLPARWSDWEEKVQKLIQHVSGVQGLGIRDVYYEVWNEPDLFGNFKISGSKSYIDLYSHTALAANRTQNVYPFKFGGPATTGYYPNWMNGLLDFVEKNNVRLDFLSWHKYSKAMSDFVLDVASARSLLVNHNLTGREMIISEIGPNSKNDPWYDNNLGAIHEIAVNTVLQNEVSKDFAFEVVDGAGPSQFWGRWGLFTNPKFGTPIAKPRANAIKFLNNLQGGTNLKVFGQGSWVMGIAKKISPTVSRILIVNYDPANIHNESVPLKLVNLPSQTFTLKRIDFLGSTTTQDVATDSGEWSTTIYFKPNSASMFEITYK